MAIRLKKTVVLVGMMGAGKTAIGTQLARKLGVRFIDSDAEIERAANMEIAEIFSRYGEPFFRQKESQIIARLLTGRPGVLSTGGGAFMQAENRALIAELGVSVWLKVDLATLWQRVKQKETRPLLKTADPRGTLARLLEERTPVYAQAQITVETLRDHTVEQSTDRVLAALAAEPDILEGIRTA